MNAAKRRQAAMAAAALAALGLGGCVNLGGGKPLPFLLTLTAPAADPLPTTAARSNANSPTLAIAQPDVPQKLRTPRIPVQQDSGTVAYLVDAAWVEPPQRLFQQLLAERISGATNRLVLGDGHPAAKARLSGALLEFGIDGPSRTARVVYQAELTSADGRSVSQRRFAAATDIGEIAPRPAGAALSAAANQIAGEVAAWIAEN